MVLETWDGRSLPQGVAHLLAARDIRGLQLTGPWSIAELELTDADFEKLLSWARQADGASLTRLIERTDVLKLPTPSDHTMLPGDAMAGLLLLALCAECTARLGSSAAPWRASAEALADCSLGRTLFSDAGAASQPLKDALRAAARRCWMRSGDLDDPTQNRWYQLLLLQAGLPRGDSTLLPNRLSNPQGRTFLVDALRQQVESFRAAWDALERFRAGQITRDRADRALASCPFFRAPHEEILDAALRSVEVGTGHRDPVPAASVLAADVRIDWPGGAAAPCAILEPSFAADDGLGPRVVLSVDGLAKATYRRTGGNLARFGGGALVVPLASHWVLTAKANDDDTIAIAEVELFEDAAPIACFDEAGARCGADAQSVRYVVANEPVFTHPPQRTVWLDAEGLAVADVDPGTTVTTRDGRHLWPASAADHAEDTDALRLEVIEWQNGDVLGALTVRLAHAPSIRVKSARVGSASFRIVTGEGGAAGAETIVQGEVSPTRATPEARLTVTACFGDRLFQRTLRFRAFTAASLDGAWLAPSSVVEASQLAAGALHVSLGREYEGHDARLATGPATTRVALDARLPPRLAQASGYGEPLLLCGQEPWLTGPRQVLAARVEHHGHVVTHEQRDGELRIAHRLILEDVADYWVLVWPRQGDVAALALGEAAPVPTGDTIVLRYRAEAPPRAVALCYRSAVMGASWAEDWSSALATAGVDATTLVKLIRLLALPVLADANLGAVAVALRALGVAEATDAIVGNADAHVVPHVHDAFNALRPSGDRDRWPFAARALLLELRLSDATQLGLLEGKMQARFPSYVPKRGPDGVVLAEEQDALAEHNRTQPWWFDAYVGLLLRAGAIHPSDAVGLTPHAKKARERLARKLADASRGLDLDAFITKSDGTRPSPRRLREASLKARRRHLGPADADILARVKDWVGRRCAPDEVLRHALLDDRMSLRIQLELLDELAFPLTP